MFQAKFDEAKYLTLGVGAVNVTFTLVAVSTKSSGNFKFQLLIYKGLKLPKSIINE